MTFAEQTASDLGVFFNDDEFAESAIYAGTAITVVEADTGERQTGQPGFITPMFTIYLKASDVARPKAGDAVIFRGMSCRVGPWPVSEGGVWKVDLIQHTGQV